MMQRFILFLGVTFISLSALGQTDIEFWFAAPDLIFNHGAGGRPLYLHFSAVHATTVTIERPADNTFNPITIPLAEGEAHSLLLSKEDGGILYTTDIETEASLGKQNDGFKITASGGEITCFYDMNSEYNRDILPLKGKNALGSEFTVTTQNIYNNSSKYGAHSGFVVMATEENTTITVDLGSVPYVNYPSGGVQSITLEKPGMCYAFQVVSKSAVNHPQGVKVRSTDPNKPIAITVYDDSMEGNSLYGYGGCLDTYSDQIVPDQLLGLDYIVMKGHLGDPMKPGNSRAEFAFVTAITDNTVVDTGGTIITTLNRGDVLPIQITNRYTYIHATNPISVTHISGAGNGCEQGGALLPTIDNCTGSYDVTFAHSYPKGDNYHLNIMVRNDPTDKQKAVNSFTLRVNGSTIPIPSRFFEFSNDPDSTFAFLIDDWSNDWSTTNEVYNWINSHIPAANPPTVATISNSAERFHLGVLQGAATNGGKYGYFSDYASSAPVAGIGGALNPNPGFFCSLDPIRIVASGGTSYEWTAHDASLNNNISNRYIADPYFTPDEPGNYAIDVKISGECHTSVTEELTLYVRIGPTSNFELSETKGCSPFTPTIKNTTELANASKMLWVIDGVDKGASFPSTFPDFDYTFTNKTTSEETHTIKLYSYGASNLCSSVLERTVTVLPEVNASFTPDSSGCTPLNITFNNTSSGHLDSTSYYWDFGDNTQSFDTTPNHEFANHFTKDSVVYTTTLIVTSPLNCTDTARKDITVYPRIQSQFSIDTNYGCSPFKVELNPKGSYGVDTLYWIVQTPTDILTSKSTLDTNFAYTHRDTTYLNGPDTLAVHLTGINKYGCISNSETRDVVVYPEVVSHVNVDKTAVCDSVPITFTNLSKGNNLKFEWNFGDYTYVQDSTYGSHSKVYLNRSDSTKDYKTTLKAISEYECISYDDTTVSVYPYLNAGFGLNYVNNCSPLNVSFNNTSTRVTDYTWSMGDGTFYYYDTSSFVHRFTNSQLYSDTTFIVRLTGKNPEGCKDSITRNIHLFQPVIPNFDIDTNRGCSPFEVNITNNSTGGSLIYTWDFGDGVSNTNTSKTFTKEYNNFSANDTTYTLTLHAKNLSGCDSSISKPVNVLSYIDADFSLPIVDSCSPLTLRLTNLSSEGSTNSHWIFGNGDESTDHNPVAPTYTNLTDSIAPYDVTLITYGSDDACADTHIIPIQIFPALQASFSMSDTMSCQPLVSSISNTSVPNKNTSFTWNLNNSFYSILENPADISIPNKASSDSVHTLWLYGSTQYGCRDTASQDLTVFSFINSYFTLDKPAICSGDSFIVNRAGSLGGIVAYNWDFNGESSDTTSTSNFYVQYDNSNSTNTTKYVELRVENSAGCDSIWRKEILVYPKVIADFEADKYEVCYPHTTRFTNNSINSSTYEWNLGDGTFSTEDEPRHDYSNFSTTNNETYSIKLTAISPALCIDSIRKEVSIYAKPNADFNFPSSIDCPPFEAEMINTSSGAGLTYKWDFASEATSSAADTSFTFQNQGTVILEKPITLIVTSDKNCKDTLTKTLSVYPEPTVDFTSSVSEGCSPLIVDFSGKTKNVLNMEWLIDDNVTFSSALTPTERFENELPKDKTHKITLIGVSLYNCSDTIEDYVTIWPTPSADFIAEPSPVDYNTELDKTTIKFQNETVFQDNWNYFWSYGDGVENNDSRKENIYSYGYRVWGDINNLNQIPVKLIAYNKEHNSCNDTANHNIIINPPPPEVDLNEDIEGCVPYTVNFEAETEYIYEDQREWDFGITAQTSSEESPTFTYTNPGVYTAKLTVHGDGGTAYDFKLITVNPQPVADFSMSDSIVYDSSQTKGYDWIEFYNYSKYGSKYRWFFDSEDLFLDETDTDTIEADSYMEEPRWAYPGLGKYIVTLIAESSKGCFDTIKNSTLPIYVLGEGNIAFPNGFFVNTNDSPPDEYDTDQRRGNLYLFYPKNIGVDEYRLQIYNKWGILMFESYDVNKGWNGYYDGQPAKQDVYVWRSKGTYTNGQAFDLSGDVVLIRTEVNIEVQ